MTRVRKASKYVPSVKAETVFSPNKSHCTKGIQYNKVLELVWMLKACRQPCSRHWEDITEDKHDKMQASNLLYMMSTSTNHDPLIGRGLHLYPELDQEGTSKIPPSTLQKSHEHCSSQAKPQWCWDKELGKQLTGLQIAQALVEAPSIFSHRESVQP